MKKRTRFAIITESYLIDARETDGNCLSFSLCGLVAKLRNEVKLKNTV